MNKKNRFSEILNKIKKEEIKPVPKWQCQLSNWSFWLAATVAMLLSSIFFSVILINLFEIPLDGFMHMQINHYLRVIFGIFPFFWLFLVIVSLVLGLVAFNKTKHGYRYNFILLVSGVLTLVLIFGSIFHGLRINKPLRDFTKNQMPHAFRDSPFNKAQNSIFVEDGLLGGKIIDKTENRIFIKNILDESWEIIKNEKTRIKREIELKKGDNIVVIGKKKGEFLFEAFVIKKIEDCPDYNPSIVKGVHNRPLNEPPY